MNIRPVKTLFADIAVCGAGLTLALGCLSAQTSAPALFPVVKSCAAGAEVIANLQASDAVNIRYSFAGESGTCYAVTAVLNGKSVSGYLIGESHPAVAAFEHDVLTQAVIVSDPPSPHPESAGPATAPAPQEEPMSFAGFRAKGFDGWAVDLSHEQAANVLIYFWSARSRAAIKATENIEAIYNTYHSRGVYVVGICSAASLDQLKKVVNENEVEGEQVLDSGGIAARYHVDPAKPFLLLDQSRKVIAAAATAQALEPTLDELTRYRRPRR